MGLLTEHEIETLKSFDDGISGYFYKMLKYLLECINKGIEEHRFTEEEARADLEIALWYAYACNNIQEYEYYYRTMLWMPDSENNAKGCGAWHYRYSVALMYCGQLEKAFEYAKKSVAEEPSYPWGWLQLAKLRYHFGDTDGAKEAVRRGLALVPGDHEFTVLDAEIDKGCTLEQMEFHYIDPESDLQLQQGNSPEYKEKMLLTAGFVCDEKALAKIKALFKVKNWNTDGPYCEFDYKLGGRNVQVVFCMNKAAVSKLPYNRLKEQLSQLSADKHLSFEDEGRQYVLEKIVFEREGEMHTLYKDVSDFDTLKFSSPSPYFNQ